MKNLALPILKIIGPNPIRPFTRVFVQALYKKARESRNPRSLPERMNWKSRSSITYYNDLSP